MNSKKNILLMFAIVFLQGFVFYGPIATLYRESRGISLSQIFIIESISWLLMLLLEVPWGWVADRFGYKKTLLVANGLFFISKIVFFKAHSFSGFLLERIMLSFVFAGLSGCDIALLHGSATEEKRDRVFSQYSAIGTAGFLVASVLSTFMIRSPLDTATIDRTGFYTIIPYALAFILTFFLKEVPMEVSTQRPKLMESVGKALKNPAVLGLVVAVALSREIYQSVAVFLNQAQYIKSGIDVRWFGLLLVLMQIGKLSGAKAHRFGEVLGAKKAIVSMLVLITTSTLLLYATRSPILSILGVLLISISTAILEPLAMIIENKAIANIDRATVLSVYAMLGELLAATVNPIIGKAADVSLGTALLFCAGMGVIAIFIFVVSNRSVRSDEAVESESLL